MDQEAKIDYHLCDVPSEDLWNELASRQQSALMVYEFIPRGPINNPEIAYNVKMFGSFPSLLGLAKFGEMYLKNQIRQSWSNGQRKDS